MHEISASDFENWKLDPVTRAFFAAAEERVEEAKEILATQAGLEISEDNFLRGFIRAYREIPLFRIEDLQETVE